MSKLKLKLAATGLNNTDNPGPGVPVMLTRPLSREFICRVLPTGPI